MDVSAYRQSGPFMGRNLPSLEPYDAQLAPVHSRVVVSDQLAGVEPVDVAAHSSTEVAGREGTSGERARVSFVSQDL